MKIDIVIPNFNGSGLIDKNLESVDKALMDYNGKIIIVDDGSEEQEVLKLEEAISRIHPSHETILIKHPVNKGFSSAVNTGVATSDADFVVLLNSDVTPHENFLKSPVSHLKNNENLFGVGCMDESMEGNTKILRGRGIAFWKNGFLQHIKGEVDDSNTFWISGGSSVIRKKYFDKIDGLDEIYNPFYWEDIDLSFRARKAGYNLLFDRESVVVHRHEEGSIKKHYKSGKVNAISYRNQFIFVWKNITSFKLISSHLILLPVNFLRSLKRGDLAFFKGFLLALLKLPAIIVKRKKQREYFSISDAEVIGNA